MNLRIKRTVMVTLPILALLTAFQNCSENSDAPLYKTTSSSSNGFNPSTTDDPGTNPTGPSGNTRQCTFFLTSGSVWTVPSDFNSTSNTVEAVGSGADGGGNVRGGGGGGAYSKSVNVSLPAGSQVAYNVAHIYMSYPVTGHTANESGGDAYLCNSTANCASMSGSAVVVGAAGGNVSTNGVPIAYNISAIDGVGGVGGQASRGIAMGPSAVKYSGGNGGNCKGMDCSYNPSTEPGSGGGAAGPHGNGGQGGAGAGMGGAADAGYGGAGGGVGQNGFAGTQWDASHGVGGGGGGGPAFTKGGNGGSYGGGGGGGGRDNMVTPVASGIGGGGMIVVKYLGRNCM